MARLPKYKTGDLVYYISTYQNGCIMYGHVSETNIFTTITNEIEHTEIKYNVIIDNKIYDYNEERLFTSFEDVDKVIREKLNAKKS